MRDRCDIAIVGAGPAGCTLAALLKLRGFDVMVFDDDKRPELLVGESLLPTVVTLMRKLGIEGAVKAKSQHKPGVAFIHREGLRMDFFFPKKLARGVPNYAYNVPRPEFDNLLRERAEELGVQFVKRRAEVEKGDPAREIRLTQACLDATSQLGGQHPRLLVDSTGRARLFARALGISARRGKRNDLAYFAHFEDFDADSARDGQVVLSVLSHGWSWRIPLPGRLSVGVVVDREAAKAHGSTPEARLESLIESEPLLREAGQNRRRISPVMTFSNYQQISDRGFGPGWVSIGDAFGFVDPMLSPGIMMAMHMADRLDRTAFVGGRSILDQPARLAKRFDKVMREMESWHRAWDEIIEYFYNGRIFSLYEGGSKLSEVYKKWAIPTIMERHLTKQITRSVSGVSTRSRYARTLIACSAKHLSWGTEGPDFYAVR
jgi:flavin-dependent dehydrogenase